MVGLLGVEGAVLACDALPEDEVQPTRRARASELTPMVRAQEFLRM